MEEASPQGKNRAMWGEEAKPLKHKKVGKEGYSV